MVLLQIILLVQHKRTVPTWSCFGAICKGKIWYTVIGPGVPSATEGWALAEKEGVGGAGLHLVIHLHPVILTQSSFFHCDPDSPFRSPPPSLILMCSVPIMDSRVTLTYAFFILSRGESSFPLLNCHHSRCKQYTFVACINTTTWNSCPQCLQIFWLYLSKETWIIRNWHFLSLFFFLLFLH